MRVVASELMSRIKENVGGGDWPGVRWIHDSAVAEPASLAGAQH